MYLSKVFVPTLYISYGFCSSFFCADTWSCARGWRVVWLLFPSQHPHGHTRRSLYGLQYIPYLSLDTCPVSIGRVSLAGLQRYANVWMWKGSEV